MRTVVVPHRRNQSLLVGRFFFFRSCSCSVSGSGTNPLGSGEINNIVWIQNPNDHWWRRSSFLWGLSAGFDATKTLQVSLKISSHVTVWRPCWFEWQTSASWWCGEVFLLMWPQMLRASWPSAAVFFDVFKCSFLVCLLRRSFSDVCVMFSDL